MIFQDALPNDMVATPGLPGMQPVSGDWLRVDEAYHGQMAQRRAFLAQRRAEVLFCPSGAIAPAQELFDMICAHLPSLGFEISDEVVRCPDGALVPLDRDDPLGTLGALVQCDLCLLHRPEGSSEHVLGGAVLCFPAGWTLAEKAGRPMMRIHKPVEEYEETLGRRVQRLLDGVQPGRPIWRFNRLYYEQPDLFAPHREDAPRAPSLAPEERPFVRAERQTLLRLPETRWVVFAIHTVVVRRADALPA